MMIRHLAPAVLAGVVLAVASGSEPPPAEPPIRSPAKASVTPTTPAPAPPPIRVPDLPVAPPVQHVGLPDDGKMVTDGRLYNNPPWHLVDVLWQDFDRGKATYELATPERVEIDVAVLTEMPEEATVFVAALQANTFRTQFYAGLSNFPLRLDPNRQFRADVLYRRWDTQDTKAIRPAAGGGGHVATHEGRLVGTVAPLDWGKPSMYTFELTAMHAERVADPAAPGAPVQRWVALNVLDHRTGVRSFAGALRHPADKFELPTFCFGSFLEVVAPPNLPKGTMIRPPKMRVAFGNVRIDGRPHNPSAVVAYYKPDVPQAAVLRTAAEHLKVFPEDAGRLPDSPHTVVAEASGKVLLANKAKPREPWQVVYLSTDKANGRDPVAYMGDEFNRKMGVVADEGGMKWFGGPGSIVRDRKR